MQKIKKQIQKLVLYLIYEKEWDWLHLIISTLADLEMNIKLLKNAEFKHHLDVCDLVGIGNFEISPAEENIPKQTFYCKDCIYHSKSNFAENLMGNQYSGYCYYLGKGDYAFSRSTETLWDSGKECGRFQFWEDEEYI